MTPTCRCTWSGRRIDIELAAAEVIDELVLAGVRLVTDAEVYQQILHRYSSLQRLDMISPAYAVLDGLADEIYTVGRSDLGEARRLVLDGAGARDAIHVATMRAHGGDPHPDLRPRVRPLHGSGTTRLTA